MSSVSLLTLTLLALGVGILLGQLSRRVKNNTRLIMALRRQLDSERERLDDVYDELSTLDRDMRG